MLLLLLSLLSQKSFSMPKIDLPCDAEACVIPYDFEGTQDGTETCYTDETRVKKVREVTWKDGKREGPVRCWKNGELTFEGTYKNDQLSGPFVQYNYDSRGDFVRYIENDEVTGLTFSTKNGKVTEFQFCYINGDAQRDAVLSCPEKDFGKYNSAIAAFKKTELEKNKLAAEALAKRKNGPQESKYPSGITRAKWTNKDDRIHGKFLSYYESGKIKSDCEFVMGKEEGPCLEYDKEGRLDKRTLFEKGKVTKEEEFYDNGKPSRVSAVADKGRTCTTEFYDTGVKKTEFCQVSENHYWSNWRIFDGPYTQWDENGDIIVKGNYDKREREGMWEHFDGKLLSSQLFYAKGRLTKSIDYKQTPPQHRIVREYFPDGSLKQEIRLEGLEGDRPKVI